MAAELANQYQETNPNMLEIDLENEMRLDSDYIPDDEIPEPRPAPVISPVVDEYN